MPNNSQRNYAREHAFVVLMVEHIHGKDEELDRNQSEAPYGKVAEMEIAGLL